MQVVPVKTDAFEYQILVGPAVLDQSAAAEQLAAIARGRRCWVIADSNTGQLFGQAVEEKLRRAGATVAGLEVVTAGEAAKSLDVAHHLYQQAVAADLDRRSLIVSLGGGVVGDLGGFIAATYLRGVDFIQWPTTLLAQVDSSVGGKVAVDLPAGKNLVGAFHQPRLVVADLDTLSSLPQSEFEGGLAEVVKYGMIMDEDFFAFLQEHQAAVNRRDPAVMEEVVARCCRLKARVVEADAHEGGVREILNYGHTFAHALEVLAGYGTLAHGAAVAIGMTMAAELATVCGLVEHAVVRQQTELLRGFGLPVIASFDLNVEQALAVMRRDKKSRDQRLRLVLPSRIGKVKVVEDIDEAQVARILENCCDHA